MTRFARLLLVFGLLAVAVPATTTAQEPTKGKTSGAEPAKGGDKLTVESLKTILEGLAYDEIVDLKDKAGKVIGYEVKRVSGWNFYGMFSLSPDQSNVWIVMWLAKVPDPGSIPAKAMRDMMAQNNKMGGPFFAYSESDNFFALKCALSNRGIGARDLRSKFEGMCDNVRIHEALWNPDKWADAKPKDKVKDGDK